MFWVWLFLGIGLGVFFLASLVFVGGLAVVRHLNRGKSNYDKLDVTFGLGVTAIILCLMGFVVGIGALITKVEMSSCGRMGRELVIETSWELVGGCYASVPEQGRSVPLDWLVPVIEGNKLRIEIVNPGQLGE